MTNGDKKIGEDLVDRLLGQFDHVIDMFHDKVLRPIIVAARVVAYGLIIALAVVILIAVLIIGLVRLLNIYAFSGHEWVTYAALGGMFVLAGMFIWRRGRPVSSEK